VPQLKPAIALKKRREEIGLSQNQLEQHAGVSRRTISRCESGDFSAESEAVGQLVEFLFKTDDEKGTILQAIDKELKFTKREIQERKKNRKELTKASKDFFGEVTIMTWPSVPEEKKLQQMKLGEENPAMSFDELRSRIDFGYYYKEPYVSVSVIERKDVAGHENTVLTINLDEGLTFFGEQWDQYLSKPFKKLGETRYLKYGTDGSKENWRAAMEPYWKFCQKRKLSPTVLLQIARKAIEEEKLLQPESYKVDRYAPVERWMMDRLKIQADSTHKPMTPSGHEQGVNILADAVVVEFMLASVNQGLDWMQKGKLKGNKTRFINDQKWVAAYLEALLKQPKDVTRIQKEMLMTIDEIIEGTTHGK
jgi:transcriptional regulator with XRE-family HTH domain